MKTLPVAPVATLVVALVVALSGLSAPASAQPSPGRPACAGPQYPVCEPTQVGLTGPARALPRTRVPFTCSIRPIGTTAKPDGTFTLRVGRAGQRVSTSGPHRVGPQGTAVIRTPRLTRGNYNVTCRFAPRSSSPFEPAVSGSRRLLVRRHVQS